MMQVNTKADLHYNIKWSFINPVRAEESTVRVQEESREHPKAFNNILESLNVF